MPLRLDFGREYLSEEASAVRDHERASVKGCRLSLGRCICISAAGYVGLVQNLAYKKWTAASITRSKMLFSVRSIVSFRPRLSARASIEVTAPRCPWPQTRSPTLLEVSLEIKKLRVGSLPTFIGVSCGLHNKRKATIIIGAINSRFDARRHQLERIQAETSNTAFRESNHAEARCGRG
jgi:hypothetical protein